MYSEHEDYMITSDGAAVSTNPSNNTTMITMASALILAIVIGSFILSIYLISKWLRHYLYEQPQPISVTHVDILPANPGNSKPASSGLEKCHVALLPSFTFGNSGGPDGVGGDCAVCLSEFQERQRARLLPACEHSFHVECIDRWLESQSTCPLCRTPVVVHVSTDPVLEHRVNIENGTIGS